MPDRLPRRLRHRLQWHRRAVAPRHSRLGQHTLVASPPFTDALLLGAFCLPPCVGLAHAATLAIAGRARPQLKRSRMLSFAPHSLLPTTGARYRPAATKACGAAHRPGARKVSSKSAARLATSAWAATPVTPRAPLRKRRIARPHLPRPRVRQLLWRRTAGQRWRQPGQRPRECGRASLLPALRKATEYHTPPPMSRTAPASHPSHARNQRAAMGRASQAERL